jgi:hypothetical protein
MCESGASFLSVHHNPAVGPHRKKPQIVMTTSQNVLLYALCTGFLNSCYLVLEHKVNV